MLTTRRNYIKKIYKNNKKISDKIEEINRLRLQSNTKRLNTSRINAISDARKYIVSLQIKNKKLTNKFNKN